MEGISSLYVAIERAKTLKIILREKREGGSYFKKRNFNFEKKAASEETEKKKEDSGEGKKRFGNKVSKKYWTCGKIRHFRSKCPMKGENRVKLNFSERVQLPREMLQ